MKLATDCTGRGIVALDLSLTSTGICYPASEHELAVDIVKTPSGVVGWQRLDFISGVVHWAVESALVLDDHPVIVAEGYSFNSRNSQAHSTGELGGVVTVDLGRRGHEITRVPPKSIKKFATGKGNANKTAVVSALAARTGWTFTTDDQADALALWCFARAHLNEPHPMDPLPKTHLAALDGFELKGQ